MITFYKITVYFSVAFIIFSYLGFTSAQDTSKIRYTTLPGSKLWIEGSSNIDEFTCTTRQVNGYAELINDTNLNSSSLKNDKAIVTVIVHTLDCGKYMMNEDMYNAMKADKYPDINYDLIKANLSTKPDSANWYSLKTYGSLYIAGVRNDVYINFNVEKLSDGNFRIIGGIPISMLDYGITPPTHFFGLIRANKNLIVHFDLLAGREEKIVKNSK